MAGAGDADQALPPRFRRFVESLGVADGDNPVALAMQDQRRQCGAGDLVEVAEAVLVLVGVRDLEKADSLDQREGVREAALDDQAGDAVLRPVDDLQRRGAAQRPAMTNSSPAETPRSASSSRVREYAVQASSISAVALGVPSLSP